jgi:hypothetical protein
MRYLLPNPKTGHDVKVSFTLLHKDATVTKWEVHAEDVRGRKIGHAVGSLRISPSWEFAKLDTSYGSSPRGKGYGLMLYLASAMFAQSQGVPGIKSFERTNDSTRFWEKMREVGLAKCYESNDMPLSLHTLCFLYGKDVEAMLRRNGWRPK